ncbi:hypothetical protein LJR129_002821 [Acidovorax sp. LjRoot129]|uniref:hypothetical protein n=1 Tax=Acidovorax sp. LjRoot129 TaxID=3342260 RepID=UPI003ECEAB13
MNYWAKDDPLFADGHYVEEWELRRFDALTDAVQAFVRVEAALGNKLQSVIERTVVLSHPPHCGVLGLPEGLAFVCPLQHSGVRVYDGDEDGVILAIEGHVRVFPSGFESPNPFAPAGMEVSGGTAV